MFKNMAYYCEIIKLFLISKVYSVLRPEFTSLIEGFKVHNCALQYASLVNNRFSIVFKSLSFTICSITINLKSDKSCGVLLKCVATSHVLLFLIIVDLWLRKRTFSSVLVDPMYCREHLIHVTRYTTF
jgi:hypothetical protein